MDSDIVREDPKPKAKTLPVRIVKAQGEAVLVEVFTKQRWSRSVVPREVVKDGRVTEADLDAGDVTVDWAALVELSATPESIAEALKRQEIFTHDDLAAKLPQAKAAIAAAYSLDLVKLIKGA